MFKQSKRQITNEKNILIELEHDPSEADGKFLEIESFWSSIHNMQEPYNLFKKNENPTYAFEIFNNKDGSKFFMSIPKSFKNIISKKLNAVYPYIEIKEIKKDYLEDIEEADYVIESLELKYTNDHGLSLKTKDSTITYLNSLLNSMNHFGEEETSIVQILIQPLPETWGAGKTVKNASPRFNNTNKVLSIVIKVIGFILTSCVMLVTGGKMGSMKEIAISNSKEDNKKSKEVDKFSKPCFNVSVRILSKSKDNIVARENAKSIASAFSTLDDKNSLRPIKININQIKERNLRKLRNSAFSNTELSQITALNGSKISADNISKGSIKMPYDKNIPSKGLLLGTSVANGKRVAFPMIPISLEHYSQIHKEHEKIIDNICKPRLVLGQMGTGKSEWVINYAISLIRMGVSLILVDPKNDTQQRLIESIPNEYAHLIDYIDLGDIAFPAPMNILRKRLDDDPTEISMIVTSLINFFKKEFGRSWGFAMQQLIQMTGNAVLLDDVCTLHEFQLLLTNQEYREYLINKIENKLNDENTKSKAMLRELLLYWKQFNSMKPKEQRAIIGSTMNKVGVFMANRLIRAIVSQKESYDFRKAGDNGRISIINIPEGLLNPENTKLLSSFINKAIWLDFQSRANIKIQERYPTVWLVEEAHEIVDDEFIGVLTKSRGYRLGVTLITQGLTNFDNRGMKHIRDLILTNCKNKILFRLGHQDAKSISEEMAPLTSFDLMNIPDYHFYGKVLLEGGKVSNAFFAKAPDMAETVRSYDQYKESHSNSKLSIDDVEEEIDSRHSIKQNISMFRSLEVDEIEKDSNEEVMLDNIN